MVLFMGIFLFAGRREQIGNRLNYKKFNRDCY